MKLNKPLHFVVFKKLISLVILVTFIPGTIVFGDLPNDNDHTSSEQNELSAQQKAFEDVGKELDNSTDQTDPGPSIDEFGITGQSLVYNGVRYPMTAFNLPNVVPGNFEKDVTVTSDVSSKRLIFSYIKKGEVIATHEIEGYSIITGARDKELYTFLDQSGNVYSIDMAYAKDYVFRGPLPVIKVGSAKSSLRRNTTATYLTRGLRPMPFAEDAVHPEDVPLDYLHTAGDFILYGPNEGQAEIVAQFNRNVIRTRIYTAEAILGFLAFLISPSLNSKNIAPELMKLQSSEEIRKSTESSLSQVDPLVSAVLTNIPKGTISSLVDRAQTNKASSSTLRDKFTNQDWQQSFSRLTLQAEGAIKKKTNIPNLESNLTGGDLGENWRALTEANMPSRTKASLLRILSSRSMKLMAMIVGGGALAYKIDPSVYGGRNTAWAVHIVNQLYDKYWPAVLKDQVYKVTLLKSSISLQSFIPMLYVIGIIGSKINGDHGAIKALARQGMRISSYTALPFFHYIARATRQPNFIRALQRGLNPFKGVQTEEGTVYPAFNTFEKGEAYDDQVAKNARLLENEAARKAKTKSMAWAFATMAVGEESGYDPATLTLLAKQGGVADQTLEKLTKDPQFQKLWIQSAQEIEYVFLHIASKAGGKDIKDLTPEELTNAYALAKSKVNEIQNRKGLSKLKGDLAIKWRRMTAALIPGFASFGVEESEFLRNADPSNFVASQFWRQFVVDYSLAVAQIGVLGARADLSHPENLAASEHHFLWTTPGHRSDMIDQVRVYGVGVPASMALVYQKNAAPVETRYNPAEEILLRGEVSPEGFFKGLREWIKAAANLGEANYAGIYQRDFKKSIKMTQSSLLWSIVGRVLIGGQNMHDAFPAFLYVMMSGTYRFGWPWAIIRRGNQVNEERAEINKVVLGNAKVRLGQGLRIGDMDQAAKGFVDLAALYEKSPTDLPEEFEALIPQLEAFLDNPNVEGVDKAQGQIANFEKELHTQGLSLLDFSMKNPPFPIKTHPLVDWTTTLMGAVSTTYLYTSLAVDSFQKNVDWGHRLIHAGLITTAFYGGTYYGQKAFIELSKLHKASKANPEGGSFTERLNARIRDCSASLRNLVKKVPGTGG